MSDFLSFTRALASFGVEGVAAGVATLRDRVVERLAEVLPGFQAGEAPADPFDVQTHAADAPADRTLSINGASLALPDPAPALAVASVVTELEGEGGP